MKKIVLFLMLCPSIAFGADNVHLQDANGNDFGSSSNPLHVSFGGSGNNTVLNVNVGIGSANPGQALDVQGTIRGFNYDGGQNDAITTYNVKTQYGATGNGITLLDGTVSSGSSAFTSASASFSANDVGKVITIVNAGALTGTAGTTDGACNTGAPTAFTSAGASFTALDVGKLININGAGAAGATLYTSIAAYVSATAVTLANGCSTTVSGATYTYGYGSDLTTTISAYTSSTAVTLTATASNTVSNVPFTYGTDDTTAIQNAINAVGSSANKVGTIYFPSGIYIVNGSFGGSNNAQLQLPTVALSSPPIGIVFRGVDGNQGNGTKNGVSVIYGTKNGSSGYSIISGVDVGQTNNLTRLYVSFQNLVFVTVQNPSHSALNLLNVDVASGDNVLFQTSIGLNNSNLNVLPTTSGSYCLIAPGVNNGNVTHGWNGIRGKNFYNGVLLGEHFVGNNLEFTHTVRAYVAANARYPIVLTAAAAEYDQYPFTCATATSYININSLQIEHDTGTYATITDVNDSNNYCNGSIDYTVFDAGGGGTFVYAGANNVSFTTPTTQTFRTSTGYGDVISTGTMSNSSTSGGNFDVRQDNQTAVSSGNRLGTLTFSGAYSTNGSTNPGAKIQALASENFSSGHGGTDLYFYTAPTGSASYASRFVIANSGNVGIGTAVPAQPFVIGTDAAAITSATIACFGANNCIGYCTGAISGDSCTSCTCAPK